MRLVIKLGDICRFSYLICILFACSSAWKGDLAFVIIFCTMAISARIGEVHADDECGIIFGKRDRVNGQEKTGPGPGGKKTE